MQNTENKEIWTALYARLSMDDGNVGESMSIGSQKAILKRKAEKMGIHSYKFYMDDGYSGTNFNRPSFQQMIADIEAGHVDCVITKDDCVIIEPTQKDLENQGFVAGSICF